jgi:hypothetical protein
MGIISRIKNNISGRTDKWNDKVAVSKKIKAIIESEINDPDVRIALVEINQITHELVKKLISPFPEHKKILEKDILEIDLEQFRRLHIKIIECYFCCFLPRVKERENIYGNNFQRLFRIDPKISFYYNMINSQPDGLNVIINKLWFDILALIKAKDQSPLAYTQFYHLFAQYIIDVFPLLEEEILKIPPKAT